MKIAFTVDVEDWYHTSDLNIDPGTWGEYERRVVQNTHRVLELMEEYQAKGTFFVLGCIAEEFPALVRDIISHGHELACHGFSHQILTRMTRDEVREDIRRAKLTLEDTGGRLVTAYRAPSWSMEPKTYFTLEVLEELGFLVDSSFQPFRTPLSGVSGSPLAPFYPIVNGHSLNLLEFPSCVSNLGGIRFPFSGGLYLRILPSGVMQKLARHTGGTRPVMTYVHPWEVDPEQPNISPSALIRFTHYYNLKGTSGKIRSLLRTFETSTLSAMIADMHFPRISLDARRAK